MPSTYSFLPPLQESLLLRAHVQSVVLGAQQVFVLVKGGQRDAQVGGDFLDGHRPFKHVAK